MGGRVVIAVTLTLRLLHMKHPDLVRRCLTVSNPALADLLRFLWDCGRALGTLNIIGSWKAVKYPTPEKAAGTEGDTRGTGTAGTGGWARGLVGAPSISPPAGAWI
jgi:hypothetical protein